MSNEPNQPAEDAPNPESEDTAGQAERADGSATKPPVASPESGADPAGAAPADAKSASAATSSDDAAADGVAGKSADATVKPAAAATPGEAKPAAGAASVEAKAEPESGGDIESAKPESGGDIESAAKPAAESGGQQRYLVTPEDDDEPERPAQGGGNSGNLKKVLIGVLAAVVLVGGFFAIRYFVTKGSTASAGDCVSVNMQSDERADLKTLDCGDDKASYQVGKVLDKADAVCPEEGLYTEVTPASGAAGQKLCLLPNMSEGACYKPDEGTGFVKGACTGPEAIKVTKVIKDSTDLTKCPDSAGMSYPEPAITYCLAPAEL